MNGRLDDEDSAATRGRFMDCPECGYVKSDLENECPRCKRLGESKQPRSEQTSAVPASALPVVPAPPAASGSSPGSVWRRPLAPDEDLLTLFGVSPAVKHSIQVGFWCLFAIIVICWGIAAYSRAAQGGGPPAAASPSPPQTTTATPQPAGGSQNMPAASAPSPTQPVQSEPPPQQAPSAAYQTTPGDTTTDSTTQTPPGTSKGLCYQKRIYNNLGTYFAVPGDRYFTRYNYPVEMIPQMANKTPYATIFGIYADGSYYCHSGPVTDAEWDSYLHSGYR